MTVSLKHAFTSAKSDGGDNTLVQPSNWNAEHQLTLANNTVLGRNAGTDGAAQELTGSDLRTLTGLATSDSPQFTAIELGHATDTTIARVSAGVISVEGSNVILASNKLSALSATTSAELAGVISDETGSGALVFATTPTFGTSTLHPAGSASAPSIAASGDTNTGLWFPAADTIAASTAGSERLRITSTGNVGIGTSSPSGALDVRGTGAYYFGSVANPRLRLVNTGGTSSTFAFGSDSGSVWLGAETNSALYFITNNAERLRIDSSGNVGIGTSSFGTSAATVLGIATGTAPTTGPADTIQIYSTDLSAGNTMLSLYTEGTPVNSNATAAATHRIAIRVNGTVYYLLANTSA